MSYMYSCSVVDVDVDVDVVVLVVVAVVTSPGAAERAVASLAAGRRRARRAVPHLRRPRLR